MTDTRTTHDRHPAGRFHAFSPRALAAPLKDAAGRSFITCEDCRTALAWNDAVAGKWKTHPSKAYAYQCPNCQE